MRIRQPNPEIWRRIEFLSPLRLVRAFHWASNAVNHLKNDAECPFSEVRCDMFSERFQNGDCRRRHWEIKCFTSRRTTLLFDDLFVSFSCPHIRFPARLCYHCAPAAAICTTTHTQARVIRSCGIANLQNAGSEIDSTKG